METCSLTSTSASASTKSRVKKAVNKVTPEPAIRAHAPQSPASSSDASSVTILCSQPALISSPINLQHMQLFHHFEISTYETFVFQPSCWKSAVVELALENTFLMHAVFLVTAAHLRHLHPEEERHQHTMLTELDHALPAFRQALNDAGNSGQSHKEALVACSLLLLQHAWLWEEPPTTVLDISACTEGWSDVIGLYSGVWNIVVNIWKHQKFGSRFSFILCYSPRLAMEAYLDKLGNSVPPDIEACFTHFLNCKEIADDGERDLTAVISQSRHLFIIWRVIRLGPQTLEDSGLVLSTARFLFTWPILHYLCFDHFVGSLDLVCIDDTRNQAMLLYYFAAIAQFTLHFDNYWWMRARAIRMFEMIFSQLEHKCHECTGNAKKLFEGEDILHQYRTACSWTYVSRHSEIPLRT